MSGNIKGITIEIGGNTQPLNKSLEGVNKKSKDLQSELRQVERLLKLDPGNTELLAQKQKLLADAVGSTSEKLQILKEAEKQVQAQFERGEVGEEQYRALQREVVATEQSLGKLESRLKETNSKWKDVSKDLTDVGGKMKDVGGSMSTNVTAPLVAGLALVTEGTKELRGDLATLETNAKTAGQEMGVLDEAMRKMEAVTGETDSNVEGLSNILAAGFKDEKLSSLVDALAGASIKFKDTMKFEGMADGLQETLATGAAIGPFAELLDRSGISLDTFNAGLQAAKKNGTEQQYVLDVLAKTGLADVYESYRKTNEAMVENTEAQYDLKTATADLGATLEPIVTAVTKKLTELLTMFNGLSPEGQKMILVIAGIAAVIGPALVVIGSLISSVGAIIGAFTAASAAIAEAGGIIAFIMGVISSPIAAVVAAIAALAAAAFIIYKNWDGIKEFFINLWAGISESVAAAWESIKLFFADLWTTIKDGAANGWEAIRGAVMAVIQPFVEIITGTFTGMQEGLATIWEGLKSYFTGVWGVIKNIFLGALLLILDVVTGNFTQLQADAEAIWGNIKESFGLIWEGIKLIFNGALEAITGAITGYWGSIKTVTATVWANVKATLSSSWEGIKATAENIWKAIKLNIETSLNWIKNLPSTMISMGKNIIQGLIDGIKSMLSELMDTARRIADSIRETISSALDIHSPSRVMMGLGAHTGEGFAIGLKNSISDINRQAQAMAGAAMPNVSSTANVNTGTATTGATNYNSPLVSITGPVYVRNDQDIQLLAREFYNLQQNATRGRGGR